MQKQRFNAAPPTQETAQSARFFIVLCSIIQFMQGMYVQERISHYIVYMAIIMRYN